MEAPKEQYGYNPNLESNLKAGTDEDIVTYTKKYVTLDYGKFIVLRPGDRVEPKDKRDKKWKPEQRHLWVIRKCCKPGDQKQANEKFKCLLAQAIADKKIGDNATNKILEANYPYLYILLDTDNQTELYNLQTHGKLLFPMTPEQRKALVEVPTPPCITVKCRTNGALGADGRPFQALAPCICPRMLLFILRQELGTSPVKSVTTQKKPSPTGRVKPSVPAVDKEPSYADPLKFTSNAAPVAPEPVSTDDTAAAPKAKEADEKNPSKKKPASAAAKKDSTPAPTPAATKEPAKSKAKTTGKSAKKPAGEKESTQPVDTTRKAKKNATENLKQVDLKDVQEDENEERQPSYGPGESSSEGSENDEELEYFEDEGEDEEGAARKDEEEMRNASGEETDEEEKPDEDDQMVESIQKDIPNTGHTLASIPLESMHPRARAFFERAMDKRFHHGDPVQMDHKSVCDLCGTIKRRKLTIGPFENLDVLFGEDAVMFQVAGQSRRGGRVANGTVSETDKENKEPSSKKKTASAKRKRGASEKSEEPDDEDDSTTVEESDDPSVIQNLMDVALKKFKVDGKAKMTPKELFEARRVKYGKHLLEKYDNNPSNPKLEKASEEEMKEVFHILKFLFAYLPEHEKKISSQAVKKYRAKRRKDRKEKKGKKDKKRKTADSVSMWD